MARATFHSGDAARGFQGRRARRKAELRERLLRAALDLFARQGFLATTVEQITGAADVGKGTFFNYFPTKEHVLAGFGDMQLAKAKEASALAQNREIPTREVLKRLIYSLAEEPGRSQPLVRSLLVANLSSASVRQLFRRKLAGGYRLIARLMEHGQRRGEIDSRLDPRELARLFHQVFLGAVLLWAILPPSKLTDRLKPAFDLFWHGIAARSGSTRKARR